MEGFSWLNPTLVGNIKMKDAGVEARKTDPGSVNASDWLEIWSLYLAAGFNFMELMDSQAQLETELFLTPQMRLNACMEKNYTFQKEA